MYIYIYILDSVYIYIYICISLGTTTLRYHASAMGPGTNLTGDAGRPYKALWSFGPQTPEPMRCLAVEKQGVSASFHDVLAYMGMLSAADAPVGKFIDLLSLI